MTGGNFRGFGGVGGFFFFLRGFFLFFFLNGEGRGEEGGEPTRRRGETRGKTGAFVIRI